MQTPLPMTIATTITIVSLWAGPGYAQLTPCPDKPNCVSSSAKGKALIAPFLIGKHSPPDAFNLLKKVLTRLPEFELITDKEDYLHYTATSSFFKFVDDIEFLLDPLQPESIQIKSASRTGYYDFGKNRSRLEMIRDLFKKEL